MNILPTANREPSTSEKFGRAFSSASQSASTAIPEQIMRQKQDRAEVEGIKKLTGMDLSGLNQDLRKVFVQQSLKKKEDDTAKFGVGLETIGAMREIASKKNIGRGSSILGFFPGETAKDRAEFSQLGTSLIPLVAAGVPVRNQKEFEQYKKVITDPSASLSEIEGALDGLERIFSQKLEGVNNSSGKEAKPQFNPSHPEHKAKAEQLYKKFKDKEKVREALRKEFEI